MADTKVSLEIGASTLVGSEQIPCVQSAANRKLTPAQIDTYIRGAGLTTELGAKATAAYVDASSSQQADNPKTGNFTFALADGASAKITRSNSASTVTGTVPPNSSVAFPINQRLDLCRYGAGAFNIAEGAGVTVHKCVDRSLSLREQYSGATLWKVGTNEWILMGDLT